MTPIIIGDSIRGYSHEIHGIDCQDNFLIIDGIHRSEKLKSAKYKKIYGDLPSDIRIVAVADGHGSSKSKYSKTGSSTATNVFCETMAEYVKKYREEMQSLFVALTREGETTRLSKWIISDWESRIISYHNMRSDIPKEEKAGLEKEDVWKLYGTTLLGMLITREFLFVFQLGDGDITFVNEKEIYPLLKNEKILGVETHSISKADSWKKVVTRVIRLESMGDVPFMCILSTDGWLNSHLSEGEFYKTCKEYFNIIQERGPEVVESNLERWLSETSRDGCGDDITTIFVFFKDA